MNESLLISQLNELKPAGARVYLVGGAVRDILLQRTGKDFDLACSFDTRIIARALADRQKGDFYLLDAKRNTSRVILHESNGRRVFYDFARLQGSSIEDDLQTRDFTINAMALDLDAPDTLIDPQGGARDLKDRILRACSPNSFADDPVRVIRAVRYAIGLDLTITPETLMGLKAAVPLVNQISRERNRDELLKVLESGKPDVGLRLLERLGILDVLRLGSAESDITIPARQCGALEELISALEGVGVKEASQGMPITSFLLRLGRFKKPILDHLARVNSSGRTLRTMDLLGAWLETYDRQSFFRVLDELSLANEEKSHLSALYDHQNDLKSMSQIPNRREIYRFFKQAPVDLCLVRLAGLLSQPPAERSAQSWLKELEKCEVLVDAWANHPEIISPKPLLNGRELMRQFQIQPGKQVGELINALLEEQAAGTIDTKIEAISWMKSLVLGK